MVLLYLRSPFLFMKIYYPFFDKVQDLFHGEAGEGKKFGWEVRELSLTLKPCYGCCGTLQRKTDAVKGC